MPTLLYFMLAISAFATASLLIPAPTLFLLPLTVAAPELAPWIAAFNLIGIGLALASRRRAAPFFLLPLLVSLWPLAALPGAIRWIDCFRGIPTPSIQPRSIARHMLYYPPSKPGARPGIIDIYGGAWQRGSPATDSRFAHYMAGRGYAVFALDYPHAPEARFPAQLDDVLASIAFIREHAAEFQTAPERLTLVGRSSGGELALLAAYRDSPSPVRAVVAFYAPSDLMRGYSEPPSPDPLNVRAVLETYTGGTPATLPEIYRAASPITYVRAHLPPTLLIHGARDHIVRPEFSRTLQRRLLESGNQAYLLELPWAEHSFDAIFSGPGNQIALSYLERFLNREM